MQYGKVIGEVWGSRIHPRLEGYKIIRVVPYNYADGVPVPSDAEVLALDTLDAHVGEMVLISSSSGVRNMLLDQTLPLKTITIAIVDQAEVACS